MTALETETTLYTQIISERLSNDTSGVLSLGAKVKDLPVSEVSEVRIYDAGSKPVITLLSNTKYGDEKRDSADAKGLSYYMDNLVDKVASVFKTQTPSTLASSTDEIARNLAVRVAATGTQNLQESLQSGEMIIATGQPIVVDGATIGTVIVSSPEGMMGDLRKEDRNTILRLFALAAGLSIILSLVLANTIANPIYDLAAAMDAGTTSKLRKDNPERVLIPDMAGRDDEIGHLSSAMRNMTAALYHRIEANEQFAADVAHEIKNPLASLRSAIETLRIAPEGEKRNRLLDVVEHDVRRLDRLVSDISNASRLDSELVKEEEDRFDLRRHSTINATFS